MSKPAEPREQATAYMDQVRAIIKKYGLGSVPEDEYAHAIDSVTAMFQHLVARH